MMMVNDHITQMKKAALCYVLSISLLVEMLQMETGMRIKQFLFTSHDGTFSPQVGLKPTDICRILAIIIDGFNGVLKQDSGTVIKEIVYLGLIRWL